MDELEENIRKILLAIGEDPNREGLKDTPARVSKAYKDLFSGYTGSPDDLMRTFEEVDGYDQIVLLKDIEFNSFCEHHMLPFYGKGHIAYLPSKRVIGISKLARLLDLYSKRLQIQERIGQQVTRALMGHLQARGAACILSARHSCISCRGVGKQHSEMVTSSVEGVFRTESVARAELFSLIGI